MTAPAVGRGVGPPAAAPGGRGRRGGRGSTGGARRNGRPQVQGKPLGRGGGAPVGRDPPLPPPCPGGLPRRLRASARGNPGTVTPLRRGSENPPSAHPLPGRWSLWIPAPRSPGGMGSVPQPAAPALTHKLICFGLFVLLFLIFYYYYFHALLLFI